MFQFTTTNVINSNTDFTSGKALWSEGDESLHIKRVNNFKKENVKAIYKAVANDAENAKVVFNFSDIKKDVVDGDQLRINLYIGLTQGSNNSRYANDFYYKGKPFTIDFIWKGEAADVVEKLVKTINKYELLVYGDKLIDIESKGTFLIISAKDEFQRFLKLTVKKFDPEPHNGLGEYIVVKDIEDLTVVDSLSKVTDSAEAFFKGKEGFGTYSYILRNLRLPTDMRTRAFGINQDETPVPGAKYNQYTIHYCVNRGILGTNAVGDTVESLTTHVFYVKEDLADDFEDSLAVIAPEGGIVNVPETNSEVTGKSINDSGLDD